MTLLRAPLIHALSDGHRISLTANRLDKLDRERVHEDAFFRVANALEHFLTDWFVRALASDPSYLLKRLASGLQNDADRRYVPGLELEGVSARVMSGTMVLRPEVTVTVPRKNRLTLQDARKIIGVENSALSMRSIEEYERIAQQLLAPSRKSYLLALPPESREVVNVVIKLRHAIAHRSERAAGDLNESLQAPALRLELRGGLPKGGKVTPARVGRYLSAVQKGRSRSCWLLEDVAGVAYRVAKTRGRHRRICGCA